MWIQAFEKELQKYFDGELTAQEIKKITSPLGIYEEKGGNTYMIRLKTACGILPLETAESIYRIVQEEKLSKLHLTTRQSFQIHNIPKQKLIKVLTKLEEKGITTKGTGGNTTRNIDCSVLSGIKMREAFDITTHALWLSKFLEQDEKNFQLPKKFKISFSSHFDDGSNVMIADLGFIAKIHKNEKGFCVYAGGGLGNKATTAMKIKDFIKEDEFIYYVLAVRDLFLEEGDWENKSRARIRFIRYRLTDSIFRQNILQRVESLKAHETIEVKLETHEKHYDTALKVNVPEHLKNVIFKQKQEGYYYLIIHPQSGNLTGDDLELIIETIKENAPSSHLRLTNEQSIYVIDLTYKEAFNLYQKLNKFTTLYPIYRSITCNGAKICKLGILNSQGVLVGIKQLFHNESDAIKNALPKVHISGCLNSCGQHQKEPIGFVGKAKKYDGNMVPMYEVFLKGRLGKSKTLGTSYGEIPAKKVPLFLLALSKLKVDTNSKDIYAFIEQKEEEIKALINRVQAVETFSENQDLYFDYEAGYKFMDKNNILWQGQFIGRAEKEKHLKQKGVVVLFTGLSGSGKSTIAALVEKEVYHKGYLTSVLDGDNLRHGLNSDLGFSKEARTENLRRVREVAKLFVETGIISFVTFIAPFIEDRSDFKEALGEDFIEVFVDTSIATCEQRDPKGLYEKFRAGEIEAFTGITSPYEPPPNPDIHLRTEEKTIQELANEVIEYLMHHKKMQ